MDHAAALMGGLQGIRQLQPVTQHLLRRERPARQPRAQRLPLHKLHGDVGLPFGLAHCVDGADVRMIQGRGRAAVPAPWRR